MYTLLHYTPIRIICYKPDFLSNILHSFDYYEGDQIKVDEMDSECSMWGRDEKSV
jgi:hypothetical protein